MRPYDTEDPLAVDCFAGQTKLSILTPLTHSTTACWSVGPVTFVSLARCAMSHEAALETILPAYEALLGELVSLGVSQTGLCLVHTQCTMRSALHVLLNISSIAPLPFPISALPHPPSLLPGPPGPAARACAYHERCLGTAGRLPGQLCASGQGRWLRAAGVGDLL